MRWATTAIIQILIRNNLIPEPYPDFVPRSIDNVFIEFHRLIYGKDLYAYKAFVYLEELITTLSTVSQSITISEMKSLLKIKDGISKEIEKIFRTINKIPTFHKEEAIKLCNNLNRYCNDCVNEFDDNMVLDINYFLSSLNQIKKIITPLLGETNRYMNFLYLRKIYNKLKNITTQEVTLEKVIEIFNFNHKRPMHFRDILWALRHNNHPNNRVLSERCLQFIKNIKGKILNKQFNDVINKNEILEFIEPLVEYFDFPDKFLLSFINLFNLYCGSSSSKNHLTEAQLIMVLTSCFFATSTYGGIPPLLPPHVLDKLTFIKECHPKFENISGRIIGIWSEKFLFTVLSTNPLKAMEQFEKNILNYGSINNLQVQLFYLNELPVNNFYNRFCLRMLKVLTTLPIETPSLDKSILLLLLTLTCKHLITAINTCSQQLQITDRNAEIVINSLQILARRCSNFGFRLANMQHFFFYLEQTASMLEGAIQLLDEGNTRSDKNNALEQINGALNRVSGTNYSLREVLNESFLDSPTMSPRSRRHRSVTLDSVENFIKSPRPR